MITTSVPINTPIYVFLNQDYRPAEFISFHQMPKSPHAVKVSYRGEMILRDYEVYTEREWCEVINRNIVSALKTGIVGGRNGRFLNREVSQFLKEPYDKVLAVSKVCKKLGIKLCEKKKDSKASEKS